MNADGSVLCRIHQTMLRFETDGNGYLLESCGECERDARRRKLMAPKRVTLAELPAALIELRGARSRTEMARVLGLNSRSHLRALELGCNPSVTTCAKLSRAGIEIYGLRGEPRPEPLVIPMTSAISDAELLGVFAQKSVKRAGDRRRKPKRRPGSMAPPPTAWHRVRNYLRRVLDRLNDPSN